MNKFFLALSNLKHNSDTYVKGTVFEGPFEQLESLVIDGVLRVVEGAETYEQALEIVTKEAEAQLEAAKAPAPAAADTWAPQKPAETTEKVEDAPADTTSTDNTDANAPIVGTGDVAPAAGTVEASTETGDNL